MIHKLKTRPEYFQAVKEGRKPFELRKADRPYSVGDTLLLQEYDPEKQEYTGDFLHAEVIYRLDDTRFGLQEGYCILGLSGIYPSSSTED